MWIGERESSSQLFKSISKKVIMRQYQNIGNQVNQDINKIQIYYNKSENNINLKHSHKHQRMKSNDRVIKKGNYYELQTMQDLMLQQRLPKKEDLQSQNVAVSSANISGGGLTNENIVTELPSRAEALNNYKVLSLGKFKTDDYGLGQYQNSLQGLLKFSIRDEERLEIQKILKEITAIKSSEELPLNKLPQIKKPTINVQAPRQVNLISEFNTEQLEKDISSLQKIKYLELSRLEHIIQILSKDPNEDLQAGSQTQNQPQPQIEQKSKQELEIVYNNLNQLKCVSNLTGIVNKIAANQSKYTEMNEWVKKSQHINELNKQILDEFENDDLILNQLEENFKKNIEGVRSILKKLSD